MGHFLGKCPASEPLVPVSKDKDGRRSCIPQRLWETEALGADAVRCLEKSTRSDISQDARVSRPAWTLFLERDLKDWALIGRDAGSLSSPVCTLGEPPCRVRWHQRQAEAP